MSLPNSSLAKHCNNEFLQPLLILCSLVYNWVMIDQELSLFHDTSPILSITDLQTPLPCDERLWHSSNSTEWHEMIQEMRIGSDDVEYRSCTFYHQDLSLSSMFQNMLSGEQKLKSRQLSAIHLKLLLHPLQMLVYHLGQLQGCFYGMYENQHRTRPHTTASISLQLGEVQSSLEKWHDLAMQNHRLDSECPITNGSLVLYHIIYLNTVTYFPGIERVIRREESNGNSWKAALQSRYFIHHSDKAVFHALQTLELIRNMPKSGRPPWWSAALYRATMILWVDRVAMSYQVISYEEKQSEMFKSDTANDIAIRAYLSHNYCTPSLAMRDGECEKPTLPDEILLHCVAILENGVPSRFSDGIKRKMQTILKNWKGV